MAAHGGSSNYQVVISHMGKDTGNTVAGLLHPSMERENIDAFVDTENLSMGEGNEDILWKLFRAIESSKISIPVISRGYVNSRWCLVELAKMVERYKSKVQIILPIFVNINRADVRDHRGIVEASFQAHEADENIWKSALKLVGGMPGFIIRDDDGDTINVVKLIMEWVMNFLNISSSIPSNYGLGKVFISYRQEDTGNTFTGFLHSALKREGINVFLDMKNLPRGQEILSNLFLAIQSSKISIPVISKHYVYGKWCLIELTEMVERYESNCQIILPIFFDVEPLDVKNQTGIVAAAFKKHKKKYEKQILERWMKALTVVGGILGYQLKDVNGNQSKLTDLVVEWALTKSSSNCWADVKNPVRLSAM
ncbi:hypothetical protein NE237_031539 [Protea cynaroides]|uniref:ADP-ribosyl cyclase/cyclic ADP-ribose hydrolase n=1 Tax=Protea cynaroides TaxID=273540 RepID=A0A9Q0L1M5_9MAGN|nr:hypothetical protein NE237_031539 [Protea cynaroides]